MADNIAVTPGTGAIVAADEIDGIKHQRVKIQHGADGTATDASAANPLPVAVGSALPAGDNNIGNVDVASVAIPAAIVHGQTTVTTAGTEVALAASTPLLSGVTIKAKPTNTGLIYVGGNPVTSSTGFILEAGESIFIEVDNLADVYVDAAENGEGVSWIGG